MIRDLSIVWKISKILDYLSGKVKKDVFIVLASFQTFLYNGIFANIYFFVCNNS